MQAILNVAIPFFALIFIGYAALRWRFLDRVSVTGLNAFVYWFALPVLLFDKVAESPLQALLNPDFFIAYYGAAFPIYGLAFLVSFTLFKAPVGRAAIMALATSFGNVGYMGIPLLITAFGPDLALPAVLATAFDNLTLVLLTVVLLEVELRAKGDGKANATALRVLKGIATNPLIIAVALGALVAASPFDLPDTLKSFNRLLGAAAAPCALFALGASLVGTKLSEDWGELLTLGFLKLFVQPFLLTLIVLYFWPVPPETGVPTLILAALPTAATAFVLAERYGIGVRISSGLVLLTHAVSVATVTGLLVWLTPG